MAVLRDQVEVYVSETSGRAHCQMLRHWMQLQLGHVGIPANWDADACTNPS